MAAKLPFSKVPSISFRRARLAVGFASDLLNVVREVNAWRHEHDAFVAMQVDEAQRREGDARRDPSARGPRA
jgi:hypothetical protein